MTKMADDNARKNFNNRLSHEEFMYNNEKVSSMKIKLLQTETIKCRPYDFELFSYYIVFRIFGERSFLLRRGFINSSTVPRVDL